ncbi:hypothetical protein GGF43_004219, partial [Coemansia sp. RSA 2618]
MTISNSTDSVIRPSSYIGIHTTDSSTKVIYVSEGCHSAVGFTPQELLNTRAKDFIADSMNHDEYSQLYDKHGSMEPNTNEDTNDNEANVYSMWVNIKSARGAPVLHRIISFRCDNTVIYLGITFPEMPFRDHSELRVQQLDRQLEQLSVSPGRNSVKRRGKRALPRPFITRNHQAKCVLVLENYATDDPRQRISGPLITFALASIDRIIDADNSDLIDYPFLKLVAPEDILHVTKFLVGLTGSTEVQFERFLLLSRPRIIPGDISISDEDNQRILVEGLGAASSKDGV